MSRIRRTCNGRVRRLLVHAGIAYKYFGHDRFVAIASQEAIERQAFGAPTYIYRDEMFWGQDWLDFLDREMAK